MVCKFCGKTHGNDVIPPCIRSGDPARPFRCPKCDSSFKNIGGFKKHYC